MLCQPEVQHLHHALGRDLDVGGFEIAMDDPRLVGGVERVGDLLRDGQQPRRSERAPRTRSVQRVALDQLQHQGRRVAGVFETVDRPDVRMIERREQSCFAFEARQPIGIGRERRRQDLDRDVAPELRVVRAIHLAHPARARDARLDPIRGPATGRPARRRARRVSACAARASSGVARKPSAVCACASSASTSRRKASSLPHASATKAARAAGVALQGRVTEVLDLAPPVTGVQRSLLPGRAAARASPGASPA